MNTLSLVITPGDPDSIGPEVTAKALKVLKPSLKNLEIVIVGSRVPFKRYSKLLSGLNVLFIEPPSRSSAGYQAGWAIETATRFVLAAPRSRVLVTGPISKERIQAAGFLFKGHTDFLADLARTKSVTMMLSNELFRVVLVTNHCPLSEVSKRVTPQALEGAIRHALGFCETELGVTKPKIAVLGLNPHAGEGGVLGREESTTLIPTLKRLQKKFPNAELLGPYPADSFFAVEAKRSKKNRHHMIVALYHDQGLIPIKLSNFSQSMNTTLGLPFIRTSVDHGTAFDIAGKNQADPGSMIYAIQNSLKFIKTRRRT